MPDAVIGALHDLIQSVRKPYQWGYVIALSEIEADHQRH